MTGLRFLFRVTRRRLDLAAEIYRIREPQKIPMVMSPDETPRLLVVASNLKVRTLPVSATAGACAPAYCRSIKRPESHRPTLSSSAPAVLVSPSPTPSRDGKRLGGALIQPPPT